MRRHYLILILILMPILLSAQSWDYVNRIGMKIYNGGLPPKLYKGLENDFYSTQMVSDSTWYPVPECPQAVWNETGILRRNSLDGTAMWTVTSSYDVFYAAAVAPNNDIITAGSSASPAVVADSIIHLTPGSHGTLITHISKTGELLHARSYSRSTYPQILMASDGSYKILANFYDSIDLGDTVLFGPADFSPRSFIASYNADDSFAGAIVMNHYTDEATSDKAGNFYFYGGFTDSLWLGGILRAVNNSGRESSFLLKTDESLNSIWTKTDCGQIISDVVLDNSQNIYLTSYFSDSATINGTAYYDTVHGYSSGGDVSMIKLDPAGNFQYVTWIRDTLRPDFVATSSVDDFGNLYYFGRYNYSLLIGDSLVTMPSFYGYSTSEVPYGARLNSTGELDLLLYAESQPSWAMTSMFCDDYSNLYVAGEHLQGLDLGPLHDTIHCTSGGSMTVYDWMGRYLIHPVTTEIADLPTDNRMLIYPNPGAGNFFIKGGISNNTSCNVFDCRGRQVLTTEINDQLIDLTGLSKGIYILQFLDKGALSYGKVAIE